jgi:hypothetical protein
MIMGAALGSIIARLIAPHIKTMIAIPPALHDASESGRHNACTKEAPERPKGPPIPVNNNAA